MLDVTFDGFNDCDIFACIDNSSFVSHIGIASREYLYNDDVQTSLRASLNETF